MSGLFVSGVISNLNLKNHVKSEIGNGSTNDQNLDGIAKAYLLFI